MKTEADTTKHLSVLRESPEGSDPNTLVRVLVLKSISFYPQDPVGASVIIADELMTDFGKTNALSFSEVANIVPDGEWDANYVRNLHIQMGFSLKIDTEQVVQYMHSFAMMAVESIKQATVRQAELANIPIPKVLQKEITRYDFNTRKFLLDQEIIEVLQAILSNPLLAGQVRDEIHAEAIKLKKMARKQRIEGAARGRAKYPLHSTNGEVKNSG